MTGPGAPDVSAYPHPLPPEAFRDLQARAAEAYMFADANRFDPVAPPGELLTGFAITDIRRFIRQLDEAELIGDVHAEHVARALIAGYVRGALQQYDRLSATLAKLVEARAAAADAALLLDLVPAEPAETAESVTVMTRWRAHMAATDEGGEE